MNDFVCAYCSRPFRANEAEVVVDGEHVHYQCDRLREEHGDMLFDLILNTLNEALTLDPQAINKLARTRVSCSENLALHPTVQCSVDADTQTFEVGLLGIINGLTQRLTGHLVGASLCEDKSIASFVRYKLVSRA